MNLDQFAGYIRTVSKTDLDTIFDQVEARKPRTPATRLGRAMALDLLAVESQMRKPAPPCDLSDDELLTALLA